jgi:hypothetical protein
MATIQTQVSLIHLDSSLNAQSVVQRTSQAPQFTPLAIEVLAVDEVAPLGDITTAKQVFVKLLSGNPLMIGLDGSTYPFRLVEAEEATLLRLDVEGLVETQTVTTIADTAGSLDGDYFTLEGKSGTWGVWYDVDNNGTSAPAHGATNALEITSVVTGNSAILVADATAVDMAASAAFSADFTVGHTVGTTLITLTDKHTGTRTNIAAGTSGFTVATTQAGATSPVVHLKSTGTSQVVVGVAPH